MKTILTVDDSASVRQVVKIALGGAGYGVIEAGDGREGLVKAKSHSVQLIITDLNMPGMDGLDFIRSLRTLAALPRDSHRFSHHGIRRGLEATGQSRRRDGLDHQALQAGAVGRDNEEAARMTPSSDPADTFRQEASELLEKLEAALLDLERSPSDHDLIDTAFRALHTIKGSGAMFGFDEVAAFAHEFESAFDRVRKGMAPATAELITIALGAKDFIRAQIEKPDEANAVIGVCILSDLRKLVQDPEGAPAAAAAAAAQPSHAAPPPAAGEKTWRVGMRFHKEVLINGCNPLLILDELAGLGKCRIVVHTAATPPLNEIEPQASYFSWDVELTTAHSRSDIEDVFIFVAGEMDLSIEEVAAAAASCRRQR